MDGAERLWLPRGERLVDQQLRTGRPFRTRGTVLVTLIRSARYQKASVSRFEIK